MRLASAPSHRPQKSTAEKVVAIAASVASLIVLAHSPGCAAGSDEPPTGSVASANSSSHATTSTGGPSTTQGATSSSATGGGGGGAGGSGSTASSTTASVASSSSGTGGCASYGHKLSIDGVDDFDATEDFTTTSGAYTAHVSWDFMYVGIGMTGPDVAANSGTKWLVAYFSGVGGTTMGVNYNTQTPGVPFAAKYHLRWKTDNSFTQALMWNGTSWVDAGWNLTGAVFQSGNYVEIQFPRSNIGSPSTVSVVMSMLNEQAGGEFTYAGVPSNAFTDGVDPDFTHSFLFDLDGCKTPSMFTPI